MMLILVVAVATATAAPDLRTAMATEQLVVVTEVLAAAAFATLAAAIFAAVVAMRAYLLEAQPGVLIALHPMGSDANLPHTTAYRVLREPVPVGPADLLPTPTLRPVRTADELEIQSSGIRTAFIEVRNVGRATVVEAEIRFAIQVKDFVRGSLIEEGAATTQDVRGEGIARISAIAADSAVILPIVIPVGGCALTVLGVTAKRLSQKPGNWTTYTIPFVSREIYAGVL
jgi:hypothetical protein